MAPMSLSARRLLTGASFVAAGATGVTATVALPLDNARGRFREDPALFQSFWTPPRLLDGTVPDAKRSTDLMLHSVDAASGTGALVDVLYPFQWEREFEAGNVTAWCRSWWWAGAMAASLYLIGLWVGTATMKERAAFDLKVPLALWNLFLAVFSFIGAARTVPHLLAMLGTYGFDYTVCRAALSSYGSGATGLWVALFIFSKYFELIDTVFLVVRKRSVGFLHWYHHCSVLMYCWHAYVCEMPTGIYFASMNYTVHAVMYFYYFLTAVLAKPPRWARLVTVMQLAQMAVGVAVTLRHLQMILTGSRPNCDGHIPNLVGALGMYASYFILFAQFFAKRYTKGKGARAPEADKKFSGLKVD